ncbi:MAG: Rrf2 family transcriptional regulator [Bacillota bacterium]
MNSCVKISEMTLMAYHAIALIARSKTGAMGAAEIAQITQKSQNTLHKVMQRLAKAEIIESSRGRGGGFMLKAQPREVLLLTIYEMFEGKLTSGDCLAGVSECIFGGCLFGKIISDIDRQFYDFLSANTIADLMKE